MSDPQRKPNDLIRSTSPYLLQHAYNPVDWKPWSSDLLENNRSEGKLLLISIGYSACHWCHVMEEHCFEDEEVAAFMNEHFVNIKVDREERPDIDHIYMDALQLMSGQGGWPLNVVALPDQRPFWGATYLPKDRWLSSLGQIVELYANDRPKVYSYADNLVRGLQQNRLLPEDGQRPEAGRIDQAIREWSANWDEEFGGNQRAPKFMMPATLDLLMQYGWRRTDRAVLEHVRNTLTRMAWGGLYDAVGGGFARYSVDLRWHIPHFEKMLYDNALLLSTYSDAYALFGDPLFKETAEGIFGFMERELTSENGGMYSALDADSLNSEGVSEEGAYYVWTLEEIEEILTHREVEVLKVYFNLNKKGHWEEGKYVLFRDRDPSFVAKEFGMDLGELKAIVEKSLLILRNHREANRKPPGLDDKFIASWNAITAGGLARAYRVFDDERYLNKALAICAFLERELMGPEGDFLRRTTGIQGEKREGFLEDYAFLIRMYIELYQSTAQGNFLQMAIRWTDRVLDQFGQDDQALLAYTPKSGEYLIRRTVELEDNVIPASNSVMCQNLWLLGRLFPSAVYGPRSEAMREQVYATSIKYPNYYALWMSVVLYEEGPFYEIAGIGQGFGDGFRSLWKKYHPHRVFAGSASETSFPEILNDKTGKESTVYYACEWGSCKLPVESPEEIDKQLNI